MDYKYILFSIDQGIAHIAFNRPKEMNSLNLEIIEELMHAFSECEVNKNIRVAVLSGNDKVFSAGDDIKIMDMSRGKTKEEIVEIIKNKGYPILIKKIMSLNKPVISSVNGVCFGAGGELAMACDYVIASDKASFGQLYINLGLIGNTYLLPMHIGIKKALELIWTGKIIDAATALQLGMINKVVSESELTNETEKIARRFANGPTIAYGLAKKAVYGGATLGLDEGLSLMVSAQGALMKTEDHKEGVSAFLEKRKAVYKGE